MRTHKIGLSIMLICYVHLISVRSLADEAQTTSGPAMVSAQAGQTSSASQSTLAAVNGGTTSSSGGGPLKAQKIEVPVDILNALSNQATATRQLLDRSQGAPGVSSIWNTVGTVVAAIVGAFFGGYFFPNRIEPLKSKLAGELEVLKSELLRKNEEIKSQLSVLSDMHKSKRELFAEMNKSACNVADSAKRIQIVSGNPDHSYMMDEMIEELDKFSTNLKALKARHTEPNLGDRDVEPYKAFQKLALEFFLFLDNTKSANLEAAQANQNADSRAKAKSELASYIVELERRADTLLKDAEQLAIHSRRQLDPVRT